MKLVSTFCQSDSAVFTLDMLDLLLSIVQLYATVHFIVPGTNPTFCQSDFTQTFYLRPLEHKTHECIGSDISKFTRTYYFFPDKVLDE